MPARRRDVDGPPHVAVGASRFCAKLRPDGPADRAFERYARGHLYPQNVVTKGWVADKVDPRQYSCNRPYAYVPEHFWAVAVRMYDQEGTTLLGFRTGSVVAVGGHSDAQNYHGTHRFRIDVSEPNRPSRFRNYRRVNMVYNMKETAPYGVDIASIHRDMQDCTIWVPTMFPGLKMLLTKFHVKVKMFDTQQIVIMGALRPDDIPFIFQAMRMMFRRYPDPKLPRTSNKRFVYREKQKRKALVDIATNKLGCETK